MLFEKEFICDRKYAYQATNSLLCSVAGKGAGLHTVFSAETFTQNVIGVGF